MLWVMKEGAKENISTWERQEAIGDWGNCHNHEIQAFDSLQKFYYEGQIKDEMGGGSSTHGRDEKCI
jgi:hypothetical protein